jgi:peptidoglycan L-alanyl-D-glutamate endopeptidase CwlK
MIHNDLSLLRIDFQETALKILDQFSRAGILYHIQETLREQGVQNAYYAQGREPLEKVNALRKNNGLYLLKSEKENTIITQTKNSNHIKGVAIDIVPVYKSGSIIWDYNNIVWLRIEEIALRLKNDVEWGGFWKSFVDPPHWEIKQG